MRIETRLITDYRGDVIEAVAILHQNDLATVVANVHRNIINEEAAGRHGMNAEQLDRQRRSFAYGNAHLANPNITRQHIDEAAERLRKEPVERLLARTLRKAAEWMEAGEVNLTAIERGGVARYDQTK